MDLSIVLPRVYPLSAKPQVTLACGVLSRDALQSVRSDLDAFVDQECETSEIGFLYEVVAHVCEVLMPDALEAAAEAEAEAAEAAAAAADLSGLHPGPDPTSRSKLTFVREYVWIHHVYGEQEEERKGGEGLGLVPGALWEFCCVLCVLVYTPYVHSFLESLPA